MFYYYGIAKFWNVTFFIGSVLLVLGWITTSEIAVKNSKTQHTISLLTEYLFSSVHGEDIDLINDVIGSQNFSTSHQQFDEATKLTTAINRELNFLEFVAAAYETKDIDRKLFKRYMKSTLSHRCDKYSDYINFWKARQPTIWEHLLRLNDKWSSETE